MLTQKYVYFSKYICSPVKNLMLYYQFITGEKVLCFHGPLLYEAKVRAKSIIGHIRKHIFYASTNFCTC